MEDQIVALLRALDAEKQRSLEEYRAVRAEARAALRLIREVVEHAPPGSVPAEENVEPPLVAEAHYRVSHLDNVAGI